jgi:hypothetical protein
MIRSNFGDAATSPERCIVRGSHMGAGPDPPELGRIEATGTRWMLMAVVQPWNEGAPARIDGAGLASCKRCVIA